MERETTKFTTVAKTRDRKNIHEIQVYIFKILIMKDDLQKRHDLYRTFACKQNKNCLQIWASSSNTEVNFAVSNSTL